MAPINRFPLDSGRTGASARRRATLLGWLPLLLLALSFGEGHSSSPDPILQAPPRPANAIGGAEFARMTSGLPGRERQRLALEELRKGNLPDFLRHLKPIHLNSLPAKPGGRPMEATVWVMPDYLAIGSDEDFLRIPLTYPSALAIARAFGAILPTRKIVDAVYQQADCRLRPEPMRAGPQMRSSEYYLKHQLEIENQRRELGCSLGELFAGHKKDVVITNRLLQQQGRIAIYGWHLREDEPIQPLSTVHGARYADYSHGVRLISPEIEIDGATVSIFDIAQDPNRAPLITREGLLRRLRKLMSTPSSGGTLEG